jgi:hypothetical protein
MKFGRTQGIVLCALGLVLLLTQGVIALRHPAAQGVPIEPVAEAPVSNPLHLPVLGTLGILTLLAGAALIATRPKYSLRDEQETLRRAHLQRRIVRR